MSPKKKVRAGIGEEAILACAYIIYLSDNTGLMKGELPCLRCGKSLHWTRTANNKHVHAGCETKDCLVFMQ